MKALFLVTSAALVASACATTKPSTTSAVQGSQAGALLPPHIVYSCSTDGSQRGGLGMIIDQSSIDHSFSAQVVAWKADGVNYDASAPSAPVTASLNADGNLMLSRTGLGLGVLRTPTVSGDYQAIASIDGNDQNMLCRQLAAPVLTNPSTTSNAPDGTNPTGTSDAPNANGAGVTNPTGTSDAPDAGSAQISPIAITKIVLSCSPDGSETSGKGAVIYKDADGTHEGQLVQWQADGSFTALQNSSTVSDQAQGSKWVYGRVGFNLSVNSDADAFTGMHAAQLVDSFDRSPVGLICNVRQ